ncbi:MAG: sialidase family protein [Anaerolineae bacterium]
MKNTQKLFCLIMVLFVLPGFATHGPRAVAAVGRISRPLVPTATLGWELILPDVYARMWRSSNYATDHTLYITTDQDMRRSTDAGDTWTTLFATRPYSEYLHISAMTWDPGDISSPTLFVARNVGYDHGEIFRSTDDGLTWQSVLAPPSTLLYDIAAVRDADNNLVVFAVGFSPDVPSVWRSADGGDTWTLANGGLADWRDLYRVFPSPTFATDHTVYLTGYCPPLRSTDGGLTWKRVETSWVDIGREVVFSPNYATDGTLWMSYFFVEPSGSDEIPPNGIVRSTDRGVTWQTVNEGLPVDYLDGYILGLGVSPDYPADPSLYAIELTLQYDATPWKLYRSTNRGDTWLAQGLAPAMTPKGLLVAERDLFFAPTIDGLWRLRNHSWEWLVNGDAELNTGWYFPITPSTADYSTAQAHGGARSIRLGIVGTANKFSYSSARQRVTLPATATAAQLSLWLYPTSTEVQQAAFSPEIAPAVEEPGLPSAAPTAGDAQFILLMDDNERILQTLVWTLDNSRTWKPYTFDMRAYIGKSVWVHFGVYNDGVGGTTGMYVDDVSLTAAEPLPAPAEPPANPAAIAEDFLVSDATGYQNAPAAAFNPEDDELLLVYRDSRGPNMPDIYAQRVRSDGRLLGNAIPISDAYDSQDDPQVAYLAAADRYLVIWSDGRNTTETPDVYGQLVRRDGSLDGGNFPIALLPGGHFRPRLTASEDAFLVVWGYAVGDASRIQGQRVSGSGALLGTRFDISDGSAWAGQPDVAYRAAADRYLVVWSDARGADQDIYAQQVLPDGTLEGDNIPVTLAPGMQAWPVIAAGGVDDAVLVVWQDWRDGVQGDIYGQRFKPGDTFLGIDIPIAGGPGLEKTPAVALWETAGSSVFFVVWEEPVGLGDIYGQRVASTGQLIGAPFVVNDDPHTQSSPALAVARTASQPVVMALWVDDRVETPGIYGQRLDANARPVGLHVGLTPLDGLQARPVIAYSPLSDRYLVAWHHIDGSGARIMAYSVSGDGALVWSPFAVATGIQTPDLAMDVAWDALNDHFLVVWSDVAPGTLDDFNVYGQIVRLDGNELVGDKITVSSAPNQQHAPTVAFSPELARYLVVFESVDATYSMTTLRGQFLSDSGVPLFTDVSANFLLTFPGANRQARYPDVAYDAASRSFVAVWQDNRTDSAGWDIYGQRVDGTTGTMLPVEFPIAAGTSQRAEFPSLAAGPAGRYLVVWQDTAAVADSDGDVMGRMLTADGAPLGTPIPIATQDAYQEGAPDVAYNAASKAFLAVWHGAPQAAYVPNIYARQLNVKGIPSADVLPVAVADDSARLWPVVAAREGRSEWLIAWEDRRADRGGERAGVYARRQRAVWSLFLPLVMRNR